MDVTNDVYVRNYNELLAIVLFFYDHLITLDREVRYIWGTPNMRAKAWYLGNRYYALGVNISRLVLTLSPTITNKYTCKYRIFLSVLISVLECVPVLVLSVLRTYALYDCNRYILLGTSSTALAALTIAVWLIFGNSLKVIQTKTNDGCMSNPMHGTCVLSVTKVRHHQRVLAKKAYETGNVRGMRIRGAAPLLQQMLKDGTTYFAMVAISKLANIFFIYFGGPAVGSSLSMLSANISVTMMCRLTLNLHQNVSNKDAATSTDIYGQSLSPHLTFELTTARTENSGASLPDFGRGRDHSPAALSSSRDDVELIELTDNYLRTY